MSETTTVRVGRSHRATVDIADLPLVSSMWWSAEKDANGRVYALHAPPGVERVYMHRLICGTPKGMDTDHINHDTLDNRRSNLRAVTRSKNMLNRRGANSNSRTGVRGVSVHTVGKDSYYRARFLVEKRSISKNFPFTPEGFAAACAFAAERAKELEA